MNRIQLLAATSIAAALTVTGSAGCSAIGGGGNAAGTRTPAAHSSSTSPEAFRRAAACMRAHGVPNFPDPTQDPQTGQWELAGGRAGKPPRSAMTACRSLLSRLPEAKGRQELKPLTAAEMAKAKQWAKCMREHGLPDFPSDPDLNGTFALPQRYAQLGKTGLRTQLEACHKYDVDGLHLQVPHP
jgi:hypothetical protein